MNEDRIFFRGNPWPQGHVITHFDWLAEARNGDAWFHFHLKTVDYSAEKEFDLDDDVEYDSDWEAPEVWGAFHRCTLSSNAWHQGGFKVGPVDHYSPKLLNGNPLRSTRNLMKWMTGMI